MKKPKAKKGSTGGASGNNNKLTAGQVFGLIVKNKLDDEVKIFGESMDDLNIRITSDFKNGREEKWLNFVREKSLI